MTSAIPTQRPRGTSTPPPVGVVVLNWNNYPASERCLRSLLGISYPATTVYLVDNGSVDSSMERLEHEFAARGVVCMRNGENLGFAAGCNAGIARALADGCAYVLLINNDCIVARQSLLEDAVALAEADPSCGIIGGKLLYWPETARIWGVGGRIRWSHDTFTGSDELDRGQYAK